MKKIFIVYAIKTDFNTDEANGKVLAEIARYDNELQAIDYCRLVQTMQIHSMHYGDDLTVMPVYVNDYPSYTK